MTRPEPSLAAASQEDALRGRLLALINAHWTTQALSVATTLQLPELLRDGPQAVEVLAQGAHCHRPSLLRLLRALTSIDVLSETEDGLYSLTAMGTLLCSDVPDSLSAWTVFCGSRSWAAWGRLGECVRNGESVRKQTSGADGFHHLEGDPEAARLFNRAMVELTQPVAGAVARAVNFSGMSLIVDVGGGYGELIATILARQPSLHGILFDLAHTAAGAGDRLAAAGVAGRCALVIGSFFEALPAKADAYLLKSVLHDWNDEAAAKILRNCRLAMGPHARLLIIERIAPEHYSNSPRDQEIARSDLNMLVGTGGRERTERQYCTMLAAAKLSVTRLQALNGAFSLFEATPH